MTTPLIAHTPKRPDTPCIGFPRKATAPDPLERPIPRPPQIPSKPIARSVTWKNEMSEAFPPSAGKRKSRVQESLEKCARVYGNTSSSWTVDSREARKPSLNMNPRLSSGSLFLRSGLQIQAQIQSMVSSGNLRGAQDLFNRVTKNEAFKAKKELSPQIQAQQDHLGRVFGNHAKNMIEQINRRR